MMVHVGMNIPDKAAVFTDVRRALRDGGTFAVFEQMRVGDGDLPYPLPWAEDGRTSFVASPDEYARDLEAARILRGPRPRTERPRPPVHPVRPDRRTGRRGSARWRSSGRGSAERIGNNIAATRAGLLAPVLILARAS